MSVELSGAESLTAPRRGRRGLALVLAIALGGLCALLLAGPANARTLAKPAYPPRTGCTVSTSTVNAGPGDTVTIVGSGFKAHETVTLWIPGASAALGSVKTDAHGSFSGSFTWPSSVNGKHATVTASAPSTTCSFSLTASRKVGSASTNRSSAATDGGLSSTGFAVLTATTIAVVLLGAGALFLGLARRTRS